jgi:hypothetical protein
MNPEANLRRLLGQLVIVLILQETLSCVVVLSILNWALEQQISHSTESESKDSRSCQPLAKSGIMTPLCIGLGARFVSADVLT